MKVLVLGVGTEIVGRVVNFVGISLTLLDGVLVRAVFFTEALHTGAFFFAPGLVLFLLHVVVGILLFWFYTISWTAFSHALDQPKISERSMKEMCVRDDLTPIRSQMTPMYDDY